MSEKKEQANLISWLRKKKVPFVSYDYWNIFNKEINRMPERRRYSIYAKMKEQGWVKSHPDIQIPVPRLSYGSLFIELKTPETYPFRKMRNGKYWIEGAKETNAWGHQYAQLTRLGELRRWGNFCCFAPDGETAKRIIEYYLALEDGDITAHGLQFEKYKFYFGRYVPEEMSIMKLV